MAALLTAIATAVSLILPPSAVTGNTGNGLAVLPPATGGKASEPSVPVGGGGGGGIQICSAMKLPCKITVRCCGASRCPVSCLYGG